MPALRAAFRVAGCDNVRTYQGSGNVLFEAPARRSALFVRIRARLGRLFGAEPVIVFRSAAELRGIVTAVPFKRYAANPAIKIYVAFLMKRPKKTPRLPARSAKDRLEIIAVRGREAFVVSRRKPRGLFYGIPNPFIEAVLGVPATCRNWSTVTKITALLQE
jgi:uncharacterized protein (DUF1697 family)